MILQKILIFIIFLGPLVFFHELGHFLFARFFGVRVETFSIGFGPKLFQFKRGDTVYAFSLIPLGGYVKMFGDDPLSDVELTPEEEKVAYTRKSKWARFWIIFGGPLANFIFAFFIYLSLVSVGEKVPQTKFGVVPATHNLHANGIRTGDVLSKVNDQKITSFDDLNMIDSKVENITVTRGGEDKLVAVDLGMMEFLKSFSEINTPLRSPIVVNSAGDSLLITEAGSKVIISLEELLDKESSNFDLYTLSDEVKMEFRPEEFSFEGLVATRMSTSTNLKDYLRENNLYPRDLLIKNIVADSAADSAKLKHNNTIIGINGVDVFSFTELRENIQKAKPDTVMTLKLLTRDGVVDFPITPQQKESNGTKYMSIGVESGVSFLSLMVEYRSTGVIDAFTRAYYRTADGMAKTLDGFRKLITGEVSLKHVGGPIAIGQVASDSFDISLSMFFRLMAIISINLGIINLFPIPVLDGGHLVFIFLELVNGGPLSRKKLQYAQQFGLSLLFLLIFVALFNDVSRLFN